MVGFSIDKQYISENATFNGKKVGDMNESERRDMEKAIRERLGECWEIKSFAYILGTYKGEVLVSRGGAIGIAGAFSRNR